jgi:hypothetical protein
MQFYLMRVFNLVFRAKLATERLKEVERNMRHSDSWNINIAVVGRRAPLRALRTPPGGG